MKKKKQYAWVAVVKAQYADRLEAERLTRGYWLGMTRTQLMASVNANALYPHEWTARRVILTPAPKTKKRSSK